MSHQVAIIPGRERFRNHQHDSVHLCMVLAGGFIERERSGSIEAGPGTVRCSGAARHDIDFAPSGARCLVLELADHECELLGPPPPRPVFLHDDWLRSLAMRLDRATGRTDPPAALALDTCI